MSTISLPAPDMAAGRQTADTASTAVEWTSFDGLYKRQYEPMVALARHLVDTREAAER